MKKILTFILALGLLSTANVASAFATDSGGDAVPISEDMPATETETSEDFWQFGSNALATGDNLNDSSTVDGLFFNFGNQINLRSTSEYNFVAGNIINYDAKSLKDAFIAGNLIKLGEQAKIGRDLYMAGNQVTIQTDLPGNLSVAAASLNLENITIEGDVNLSVGTINFGENTRIKGTLTYNDDAKLNGFNANNYAAVSTYTPETNEPTAAEIWLNKFIGMVSFFILIALIFWLLPSSKKQLYSNNATQNLAKYFVLGIGFLIIAPVIALILLASVFAAPAALVILAVYIIVMYLSQAFTGAFLGYLIVERLMRSKLPVLLEALIGIVLYGCLCLVPGLSILVTAIGTILGVGLIIGCFRGTADDKAELKDNSTTKTKSIENPFRGQKEKSSKTVKTTTTKTRKTTTKKKPTNKTK